MAVCSRTSLRNVIGRYFTGGGRLYVPQRIADSLCSPRCLHAVIIRAWYVGDDLTASQVQAQALPIAGPLLLNRRVREERAWERCRQKSSCARTT
jgi:hypothetical protein